MKPSLWNEIAQRIEAKARARRPGPDLITLPAGQARSLGAWLPEEIDDNDLVEYRRLPSGEYGLVEGAVSE